ncbi:MAG: alkaline phosphatase [Halobaculum sp.]
MRDEHLQSLITADDPVAVAWDALWELWSETPETAADHYSKTRETAAVDLEWRLYRVYEELFTEVLPERCVSRPALSVPDDGALVVMDAASVREAALFVEALVDAGYETHVDYDYATVPSETTPFRERVGYDALRREYESTKVSTTEPTLRGDERVVWAPYPDTLVESIQEGKTEKATPAEAYEKTEHALVQILSELDTDRVVIRSDHGYTRLASGLGFPASEDVQNRLQDVFSGGRSVGVGELDETALATAESLADDGVVAEADGWFAPVGRFTWPARGKYSTYQHGGVGLTEVLTPKITVER